MAKRRGVGSRGRTSSSQNDSEVTSARDRFKGALQELLPQPETEESDSSDEETWATKTRRMTMQKKKQTEKTPNETETKQQAQPFVMKLFDRSVDLAQFNEKSPLYLICRAWIANQPHQIYNSPPPPKKSPSIDPEDEAVEENGLDDIKDTYHLPPPTPIEGGPNKLRIPPPILREPGILMKQEEGSEPPSKEDLLKENLSHWAKVRASWLQASNKHGERYEKSYKILAAMYNQAQKQYISQ